MNRTIFIGLCCNNAIYYCAIAVNVYIIDLNIPVVSKEI